jgi:hypothetical protein
LIDHQVEGAFFTKPQMISRKEIKTMPSGVYEHNKGKDDFKWIPRIEKICPQCGKIFECRPKENRKFCTKECKTAFQKGKKLSKEHCKNLSIGQTGKPKKFRTKEHCDNISKANKGKLKDRNYEEIMGSKEKAKLRLVKQSENSKKMWENRTEIERNVIGKKISKAQRGVPESDVTKIKNSIASNNKANAKYKKGWYTDKQGNSHFYASSYELRRMQFLDSKNIIFVKNHHHHIIWLDDSGKSHAYTPDVFRPNESILEEIKPKYKLTDPEIIAKAQAAEEYCRDKNLSYKIIMEDNLEKL